MTSLYCPSYQAFSLRRFTEGQCAVTDDEIALLNPETTLVSFIWPAQNPELMQKLAERNVTVMAMDSVPRISARTIAGRTKLDGEYRRLSRHC